MLKRAILGVHFGAHHLCVVLLLNQQRKLILLPSTHTSHPSRECRLVVLISGRGSNLQAIVESCVREGWPARIVAVIANRPDAAGLAWAAERGIATAVVPHRGYPSREAFDAALADVVEGYRPDYVLLAGFMRVLTNDFVARFAGRLLNIHPSLLPLFPGLRTHAQALEAGVQVHGCTVHFVTPVLDLGPIVAQGVVPVYATDTPEELERRVLQIEHIVYPAVVRWLAEGRVSLQGNRVNVLGCDTRLFGLNHNEPST